MAWSFVKFIIVKNLNKSYLCLGGIQNEKKFKYKKNGYECTTISNRCHITSNYSSSRFTNATWFCISNVIYYNDYKW